MWIEILLRKLSWQTVNSYMLHDLLNSIRGITDIDEESFRYKNFDNNSDNGYLFVRDELIPNWSSKIDRLMICDSCGKYNILTMDKPSNYQPDDKSE